MSAGRQKLKQVAAEFEIDAKSIMTLSYPGSGHSLYCVVAPEYYDDPFACS